MDAVGVQLDADAGVLGGVVRGLDEPLEALEVHDDVVLHSLEGDGGDSAGELALLHGDDVDILGPDDHVHRLVGGEAPVQAGELPAIHLHHVVPGHGAVDDVGLADEVRHEGVLGLVVDVLRGADLLDGALVHDDDGVGHGEGLLLVVGDIDEGDAHLLLDALELDLHVLAELQVEGAQGLVQKQYLGPVDKGPGDGHPLLLAAGELVRPPVLKALEADGLQHLQHPLADLLLGDLDGLFRVVGVRALLHPEAEGHVLKNVQVREEGVLLEDGVDLPLVGRNVIDPHTVEEHVAAGGRREAADDPQRRGLAAAAGT